jgi:hypothetical protein
VQVPLVAQELWGQQDQLEQQRREQEELLVHRVELDLQAQGEVLEPQQREQQALLDLQEQEELLEQLDQKVPMVLSDPDLEQDQKDKRDKLEHRDLLDLLVIHVEKVLLMMLQHIHQPLFIIQINVAEKDPFTLKEEVHHRSVHSVLTMWKGMQWSNQTSLILDV